MMKESGVLTKVPYGYVVESRSEPPAFLPYLVLLKDSGLFSNNDKITAVYTETFAVPEGWKLVPTKPTDAMQVAAANAIRFDTTNINKLWTGKRVFAAALDAAPTPEDYHD